MFIKNIFCHTIKTADNASGFEFAEKGELGAQRQELQDNERTVWGVAHQSRHGAPPCARFDHKTELAKFESSPDQKDQAALALGRVLIKHLFLPVLAAAAIGVGAYRAVCDGAILFTS